MPKSLLNIDPTLGPNINDQKIISCVDSIPADLTPNINSHLTADQIEYYVAYSIPSWPETRVKGSEFFPGN